VAELLSPAGNLEKLKVAFAYGADAAYMGLDRFSLRANADNFSDGDLEAVKALKATTGKRLYCALNILFHEGQMEDLKAALPRLKAWPFDAFIISDLGCVNVLRKAFGDGVELHLSTQASCTNSESAKLYHSLGFRRVILGRETPLSDIRKIKDAVPDLQLEVFVHGAMCMAYSGRCLLSSALAGRSSNQGDCTHTCRWNYALTEEKRPGEYYPIEEHDGYSTILSSKDLCMIDHLDELLDAGVDSMKIEGRMKSGYYVGLVTRAYRKALDKDPDWREYRKGLFEFSHREYCTGFFYGSGPLSAITEEGYQRDWVFLGYLKEEIKPSVWSLDLRNQIKKGQTIQYVSPESPNIPDDSYTLLDSSFHFVDQIDHGKVQYLQTDKPVRAGSILRRRAVSHEEQLGSN
jgi:putative protease